tara:strand:+ start:4462 stop:5196 length:735 start_codon:yes stop_codon:yes gene_type:complete
MIQKVKINSIFSNPINPRVIKENKFKKLVDSIKEFPEMLKLRPIVVNSEGGIIGGNMRYKACEELGFKDVWIIKAENLTEKQIEQFIIKDNVGFGEWDWDILANDWDVKELEDWGLDGFPFENDIEEPDSKYSVKIESPTYKPSNDKPKLNNLLDDSKYKELVKEINVLELDKKEKEFLIKAAQRHIVFDYSKIADYYSHSNKDVQQLMEKSALIIIDFDQAIENGYVKLTNEIAESYSKNGIL